MKWKSFFFTPPLPLHFSGAHCYPQSPDKKNETKQHKEKKIKKRNNPLSHNSPYPKKSKASICSEVSGKSSCGHRSLHENHSVGVCQSKEAPDRQTDRWTETVLQCSHLQRSDPLLFIPPHDRMYFPTVQLCPSARTLTQSSGTDFEILDFILFAQNVIFIYFSKGFLCALCLNPVVLQ